MNFKLKTKSFIKNFTKFSQITINSFLITLSVILIYLIFMETFLLIDLIVNNEYTNDFYKDFLKSLLTFFIYFEFTAMIIKYFKENYHFPLRYFMYIGITATIRVIIVDHESGLETLYFALSILVLVLGYGVISFLSILKKKWNIDE